jgi:hypothetical protein
VAFYNPLTTQFVRVALGLAESDSKKANVCNDLILILLEKAGIEKGDLYVPVNDTAAAAVKVGEYLTGIKGTCAFHRANLIMEHATGHHTCKKYGEIWDSFPECEAIGKATYELRSYYMNNKKKSIFKDLSK